MSSVVKKEILHHAALILIQAFCAVVFMTDAISDIMKNGEHYTHLAIEFITSTALIVAIVFETRKLMELLQRHASLERTLENASQAVHVVIENKFVEWSLTPSERDVSALLVKGISTAEIASIRGTSDGTVKAQLNAIYRKSGSKSRSDLMSQILDAMIDRPLPLVTQEKKPSGSESRSD